MLDFDFFAPRDLLTRLRLDHVGGESFGVHPYFARQGDEGRLGVIPIGPCEATFELGAVKLP